jgi:uncharacterized protein (TIGR00251 family)
VGRARRQSGPPARIELRVAPGAARTEVVGRHGEAWKVRLAAPAERGRANDALTRLLADTLGVERASVRLVAGATSRDKVVEVDGMTLAEAERLLSPKRRKGTG